MFFSRTTKRNTLIYCYIITDNGSLTDDNTVSMVNEQTFTYCGTRMNLYTGFSGCPLRYKPCSELMFFQVMFMGPSVAVYCSEAGIQQNL